MDDVDILPTQGRRLPVFKGEMSECPIESGVVYSKWGAVQMGTVLAGIATGLEPMVLNYENRNLDNRFASTLVGDLVEAAVYQGASGNIKIGASGGWNSTQLPRHYFISENEDFYITDAEIRAGVDGLIISKNIDKWRRDYSGIKISQVLDMYYSQRGVYTDEVRACNRKNYLTTAATISEIKYQANAFGIMYNKEIGIGQTIKDEGILKFTNDTVDQFFQYIREFFFFVVSYRK